MSQALSEASYRRAAMTIAVAAIVTLIAALASVLDAARFAPPAAKGMVLPGFAGAAARASLILIETKDATYRIARTGEGWALRDKGDYPVRREALAEFTQGLAGLTYVRPMTRDPGKLDRLGLGDPEKGGDGVLVRVENAQGAYLANLLLGIEPRGTYMRDPDKTQSWAVKGDLPPLGDPAAWLDLAPLSIDKNRIARVDVAPEEGPAFAVKRESAHDRDFALAAPFDRYLVISPEGLAHVGEAMATLAPIDVAGAPSIEGPMRARLTMRTFDGLVIDGELYGEGGHHWLKFVARGENTAAQTEAQAINARAAPWAYALSDIDYRNAAPSLALIAHAPDAAPKPVGAPAP